MTKTMVKHHYHWVTYFFINKLMHLLFYIPGLRDVIVTITEDVWLQYILIASAHKKEFIPKCRRYLFSEQKLTTQHSKILIKKLLKVLQVVLSVKLKFIQIHSAIGKKRKTCTSEPLQFDCNLLHKQHVISLLK